MATRALLSVVLTLLLLFVVPSPIPHVIKCQDTRPQTADVTEAGGDVGIVGDEDVQHSGDQPLSTAPGVGTVYIFPKNSARLVPAGEDGEVLVGVNNEAEATINVIAIRASLHYPFDHHILIQNLTFQEFYNVTVPPSTQAAFPYIFAVSKYLQPGSFDLVGSIIYEIGQHQYQTFFYNGTIEVVEAGGLLNVESVFLVILGIALVALSGFWVYGRVQGFSKEVGTATTDAKLDEWLKGTAYAQSLKSRK